MKKNIIIFTLFFLLLSIMGISCEKGFSKNKSLSKKVSDLQTEILILKMQVDGLTDGSATISTEEKLYAIAQTKYGAFSVVCRNTIPYLDGYKVQLSIGNLTNATFNGAKLKFQWGNDLSHEKDVSVTNIFLPGRYSNVEAILTPAKPEDIRSISISLEFNNMALYRP